MSETKKAQDELLAMKIKEWEKEVKDFSKRYWICRDLSNGDGTVKDCYLWIYESFLQAVVRFFIHLFSRNKTSLTWPIKLQLRGFKPKDKKIIYHLHYWHIKEVIWDNNPNFKGE